MMENSLINLAVVLEDMATHKRVLASEEFNIASPELIIQVLIMCQSNILSFKGPKLQSTCFGFTHLFIYIQVADEDSIVPNKQLTATVTFTNSFSRPVSGLLTVAGAGLIAGKKQFRMPSLRPGGKASQSITLTPSMAGVKMLQASISLSDTNTIRCFKMISVNSV
ncbi:hypothetical protein XENOCAPTIV_005424 [Xenoophorus captivus]|uniref:Transglutaminase C-terminal domain-containing protein n=1 Tax=Xenoophorus captivus TaxID=1517983 RepID=A0ABV0RZQ7_9TELE